MIKNNEYDEYIISIAKEIINSGKCSISLIEKLNELIFKLISSRQCEIFQEEEQWELIKNYPNYKISTKGRVESISKILF